MSTISSDRDSRSVVDLIKDLRDEATTLMRQEFALAKKEMSEKASRTGRNLGYLAVGGLVGFAAVMLLLLAVTGAIWAVLNALTLPLAVTIWLAPLLSGAIVSVIAYSLIQKAITTLKNESVVPEQTVESLKEDKEWLQRKAK